MNERDERRAESLARTDREILEEKAAALRRIAGTLERHLAELHRLRHEVTLARGARRRREIARYNRIREEADRYRWYLTIQREAIGFREHRFVDRLYPLPPRLGS